MPLEITQFLVVFQVVSMIIGRFLAWGNQIGQTYCSPRKSHGTLDQKPTVKEP